MSGRRLLLAVTGLAQWSVVVFEGLGWLLRGMVGAAGPSAFRAIMTGLGLKVWGEECGVFLRDGK